MGGTFTLTAANKPSVQRQKDLNAFMGDQGVQKAFGAANNAFQRDAENALIGIGPYYGDQHEKNTANWWADYGSSLGWTPQAGTADKSAFDTQMAQSGIQQGSADYMDRWNKYSQAASNNIFGGFGGFQGGDTSIGGVSAVNPQAGQANELDAFKRYEDMAFNNALSRLQPAFNQQQAQFNQGMVSGGIPVGSDAWKNANRQMAQNQSDALQNATFGAMQFGLGAQDQSFQQDATRSGLANALLRSKWQTDLGWADNALKRDALAQEGQQFNSRLGYDYDTFYDTMANRQYEYDTGLDQSYWDRGNYWDYMFDRADSNDYFNAYDRDFQSRAYDDDLLMRLFGQPAPGVAGQNAGGIYGQQIGNATRPGFEFLAGLGFL